MHGDGSARLRSCRGEDEEAAANSPKSLLRGERAARGGRALRRRAHRSRDRRHGRRPADRARRRSAASALGLRSGQRPVRPRLRRAAGRSPIRRCAGPCRWRSTGRLWSRALDVPRPRDRAPAWSRPASRSCPIPPCPTGRRLRLQRGARRRRGLIAGLGLRSAASGCASPCRTGPATGSSSPICGATGG